MLNLYTNICSYIAILRVMAIHIATGLMIHCVNVHTCMYSFSYLHMYVRSLIISIKTMECVVQDTLSIKFVNHA